MIYRHTTDVGTFVIRRSEKSGRYELWLGEERFAAYLTVEAAVADVYAHKSGYPPWDIQPKLIAPKDLSGWRQSE